MGTGFHDLRVWSDAKNLAVATYRATEGLKDFGLRDQIRRSAVSVPSNIAEGEKRAPIKMPFVSSTSLRDP